MEEAKQGHPVRLRAVITYYDAQEPDLFVQDATAGIWVNLEIDKPNVPIQTGDLVEVEGVTEALDFAPQVGSPRFKILGHGPLPPAKRVSYERMATTEIDSQRVEVEGIIHKVWKRGDDLFLDVAVEGGRVTGRLPSYTQAVPTELVDARVRLRGTCGAEFNSKNQLTGILVNIRTNLKLKCCNPLQPILSRLLSGRSPIC